MNIIQRIAQRLSPKVFNPYSVNFLPWKKSFGVTFKNNSVENLKAFRSTVYLCVTLRAEAVAKSDYFLYVATRDKRAIRKEIEVPESHPWFAAVNRTNKYGHTFYDIKYLTQVYKDLFGNAYWYIERDNLGRPEEIIILSPQYVTVVPGEDGTVVEYLYEANGKKETLAAEDVIHHKYPNPSNHYYGLAPLMAAAYNADIDELQSLYQKTFLQNDYTPRLALLSEGRIHEDVYDDLSQRFQEAYSGAGRAGMPFVLDSGVKLEKISLSSKEMDYLKSREQNAEEIMRVFKVPKFIAGMSSDVNRSTSVSSINSFIDNTISPLLESTKQVIESFVRRTYDDRLKVKYWIERPSDQELVLAENIAGLKYGYFSPNEVRERLGYDPVEGHDELAPVQDFSRTEDSVSDVLKSVGLASEPKQV